MSAAAARLPRPGSPSAWLLACRPATLPAAVAPVVVGASAAHAHGALRPGPTAAALAGAMLLQIASNLANDVFDAEKGADTAERLGPVRAVQAGLLEARAVKRGLLVVLALALAVGSYLTWAAGPAIVVIGLCSMAAAVAYTGGPYPLGYHGLGDAFVFVFFGPVAVCGTAWVSLGFVPALAVWTSVPIGALATAILVVNNLRDRETDARAGKRTLAVRLGRRGALGEHAALLAVAFLVPLALALGGLAGWATLAPWLSLPLAVRLARDVRAREGRALNASLVATARLLALFGALLGVGLWLGGHPG
ncbi:MAG: 1,4-dihydroxy-2-naphthoate polyprenyltransferase [Polyangiaceae bacterium]|nr:1,4-dihydroxy-2-naphthoate polyprenyltransferase [Polyangiaceae bacterium]